MITPFRSFVPRDARARSGGRLELKHIALATVVVGLLASPRAEAQFLGTGGTTGATTISNTDFFIGAQQVQNVNLNDRDRANFLNQASCFCRKDVWVNAILQPSAVLRAAAIPATATVSLYVGNGCDSPTLIGYCLPLQVGVPFSDFRLNGILVHTTVNVLAREYSMFHAYDSTVPILGDTRTDSCIASTTDYCSAIQGTGGASGSGGSSGSGGDSAIGGSGGGASSGSGGDGFGGSGGTGGIAGTTTGITSSSSQTVWLFVSTMGVYAQDVASVSTTWVLDITPPCPPTGLTLAPANEALITSWTAVDATLSGNDLAGYQLICARGLPQDDGVQVFKSGTFSAAFDDRCSSSASPFQRVDSTFACSDLLSSASTSDRLKILENGISYGVGVVAVDNHRNASVVIPSYDRPVPTRDFYSEYRDNGYPQGQAEGGFCSVGEPSRDARPGTAIALGLAAVGAIALGLARRRATRRGRRP